MDRGLSQKQRLEVKNILIMDLVLKNMELFTSQDVNWYWITCGLLWCFYQLFGLSFWRHPFTAEDPLMSKWCNAQFLQICSDEDKNSTTSWMACVWIHFQQIIFFWWIIPLTQINDSWKPSATFWIQHLDTFIYVCACTISITIRFKQHANSCILSKIII